MTPEKEKWQPRFLKALAERPIIARAARRAGISRTTAYHYRDTDPEFAAAWSEALDEGIDGLVDVAWERAERESDTLTIFLLKCHRPEVYRDTSRVDVNVGRMSDDELIARAAGALAGSGAEGPGHPGIVIQDELGI